MVEGTTVPTLHSMAEGNPPALASSSLPGFLISQSSFEPQIICHIPEFKQTSAHNQTSYPRVHLSLSSYQGCVKLDLLSQSWPIWAAMPWKDIHSKSGIFLDSSNKSFMFLSLSWLGHPKNVRHDTHLSYGGSGALGGLLTQLYYLRNHPRPLHGHQNYGPQLLGWLQGVR